ncbi:hypothetical protein HN873_035488, partial [Arachis hypogaea]
MHKPKARYNDIAKFGYTAMGRSKFIGEEDLSQSNSPTSQNASNVKRPAGLGGVMIGIEEQMRSHFTWMAFHGTASFLHGIFFIFVRLPIVGILFEIYSCFVLFGHFWSSIKVFLYHIPLLGWIIQFIFRK